jgi:hypothetical protein
MAEPRSDLGILVCFRNAAEDSRVLGSDSFRRSDFKLGEDLGVVPSLQHAREGRLAIR